MMPTISVVFESLLPTFDGDEVLPAGIVTSQSGAGGGWRLVGCPEEVTLRDVFRAVEPEQQRPQGAADTKDGPHADTDFAQGPCPHRNQRQPLAYQ